MRLATRARFCIFFLPSFSRYKNQKPTRGLGVSLVIPAVARDDDFHLGGSVETVEISPKLAQIAANAAKILELDIAGVDLLESQRGLLVLEVNSSPGLEGIEKASQINVAGAVASFLNEKLQAIEAGKNQFDSESASSSSGDFTHAF